MSSFLTSCVKQINVLLYTFYLGFCESISPAVVCIGFCKSISPAVVCIGFCKSISRAGVCMPDRVLQLTVLCTCFGFVCNINK